MSNGSPFVPSFENWTARSNCFTSMSSPIDARFDWMICARSGHGDSLQV